MATNENDWVFVDIDGNEVPEGDPASQTRYTREHFKSLDKAAVFGAAPVAPAPAKAETAPEVDEQPAKSAHAKK